MTAEIISQKNREELHGTIWKISNKLRGAVSGWDFKQFVLGTMFYRYVSENIAEYVNKEFELDYANLTDKEAENLRKEVLGVKGFFILPSELFCNVLKDSESNDISEKLDTILKNIEESAKETEDAENFAGLFADIDTNSSKLGKDSKERNERLSQLLQGIAEMKLSCKNNSIDAFGDAYEFLMNMYAFNAGKSGGEYFTPAEVSELVARIATVGKTDVKNVYDPTCGSGSLLLKAAKIIGKDHVKNGFYGQEINSTSYNLCRMNMFLHDISYKKFKIAYGDTLLNPQLQNEKPFDVIVSNPPYSIEWACDKNSELIKDSRFAPAGVLAPRSKADLAFVMHCASWLADNGTAAIVCFPGILYRSGAEKKIRKYLVDSNFIDCIISLPQNLFFGTSVATAIMVLKKSKQDNNVLFIDASKECTKVTNNNKLTEKNIGNILQAFTERTDKDYFCKLVSKEVVAENDYNLSVSTYVQQEDTREKIDIKKLNAEIKRIEERRRFLCAEIDKLIEELEGD